MENLGQENITDHDLTLSVLLCKDTKVFSLKILQSFRQGSLAPTWPAAYNCYTLCNSLSCDLG